LTLALLAQLSLSQLSRAAEPAGSLGQFQGRWIVDFHAFVMLPDGAPIRTDNGANFSEYRIFFAGQGAFETAKEGTVSFEIMDGRFYHLAKWEAADGTKGDYQFAGSGTLKGSGQFVGSALKLKLEWKPGEGAGTFAGKAITQSVISDAVASEWELKSVEPWAEATPQWRRRALTFVGQQMSKMPQKIGDCPTLPLVESLEIVKAPTADLEVNVKVSPESGVAGRNCALSITIKNLGPEESPGAIVRVVLPPGTQVISPKDMTKKADVFDTLKLPIEQLAKNAVTTVNVEYGVAGEKEPATKSAEILVLAHVTGTGYDPNQANNGRFIRTQFNPK